MHGRMSSSLVPPVRRSKDGLQIPVSSEMEVLPPEPTSALQLPRIFGAAQPAAPASKYTHQDSRPFSANANHSVGAVYVPTPRPDANSQLSDVGRPLSVDTGRSALRKRQDAAGRPPLDPSSLLSPGGSSRGAAIRIPLSQRSPRPPPLLSGTDEEARLRQRRMDIRHFAAERRDAGPVARSFESGEDEGGGGGSTFFLTDVGLAAAEPPSRTRSPSASPPQPAERAVTRCVPPPGTKTSLCAAAIRSGHHQDRAEGCRSTIHAARYGFYTA